ncbi:hypothetical protein TRVA0_022S00540 [Trichomonascus vanleenenianus]|uniref:F-box protein n=1 Tax=Trichomonascus vanleenenianus TaxID=2268995 RepID=UPI003ECB2251
MECLPTELLVSIFDYADEQSLANLKLACKRFHLVISRRQWRNLVVIIGRDHTPALVGGLVSHEDVFARPASLVVTSDRLAELNRDVRAIGLPGITDHIVHLVVVNFAAARSLSTPALSLSGSAWSKTVVPEIGWFSQNCRAILPRVGHVSVYCEPVTSVLNGRILSAFPAAAKSVHHVLLPFREYFLGDLDGDGGAAPPDVVTDYVMSPNSGSVKVVWSSDTMIRSFYNKSLANCQLKVIVENDRSKTTSAVDAKLLKSLLASCGTTVHELTLDVDINASADEALFDWVPASVKELRLIGAYTADEGMQPLLPPLPPPLESAGNSPYSSDSESEEEYLVRRTSNSTVERLSVTAKSIGAIKDMCFNGLLSVDAHFTDSPEQEAVFKEMLRTLIHKAPQLETLRYRGVGGAMAELNGPEIHSWIDAH